MKKYLLVSLVFVLGIIFFPSVTKAQYTSPYVYNGNAYLNYAIASQRARTARKGHRATKNKKKTSSKRKSVHHKSRRVSMNENFVEPGLFILNLPKRTVIV